MVSKYYKFSIVPVPYAASGKANEVFMEYKEALRKMAKAQSFPHSRSLKVIFIIPLPETMSLKGKVSNMGRFHHGQENNNNMLLSAFIEGIRYALVRSSNLDLGRIDAAKYWGREGAILVRPIPDEDFEYLRLGYGD